MDDEEVKEKYKDCSPEELRLKIESCSVRNKLLRALYDKSVLIEDRINYHSQELVTLRKLKAMAKREATIFLD